MWPVRKLFYTPPYTKHGWPILRTTLLKGRNEL